jgi:hypothetical protein
MWENTESYETHHVIGKLLGNLWELGNLGKFVESEETVQIPTTADRRYVSFLLPPAIQSFTPVSTMAR